MEACVFRRVIPTLLVPFLLIPNASAVAAPCWQPPVSARVSDEFREPPCPFCAGNRGIEYAVAPRTSVRSVAAGTVTWSGTIAGVRWVVVQHADGWRATYGRLAGSTLAAGDRVGARQVVGTTSSELYFGLRIGERYVDPAPYLAQLAGRARLVPLDRTASRPAPLPYWSCRAGGVGGARLR